MDKDLVRAVTITFVNMEQKFFPNVDDIQWGDEFVIVTAGENSASVRRDTILVLEDFRIEKDKLGE